MTSSKMQALAIADKISDLIKNGRLANGAPIEPKDIAVLMRSVKGNLAASVSDALKNIGISSDIAENGDLFMCEDVLLALSFLYCIDNPRKDVYLTAVMLSPVFSFTADDILKIRKSSDEESLWEAVFEFSEKNPDDTRALEFINTILKYRKLAEGEPTDALLSLIYRECGLLALAAKNGGKENLILLHSYARKYENSDFKGLYSFISYINAVIERGEEFSSASSESDGNGVKIMTVHKSKGLEFPVTIIAGASSKSNSVRDGKIVFSEDFGICLKLKDNSGLAIVENPVYNAIRHYTRLREFDEELRVLYVALTRAREYLYVYATSPKTDTEDYISLTDSVRDILSPYFATKAKSFLDIIMFSRNSGRLFTDFAKSDSDIQKSDTDSTILKEDDESDSEFLPTKKTNNPDDESLESLFLSRFNFEYPLSYLETLPEKVSVSKLSPASLDETEKDTYTLEDLLLYEEYTEGKEVTQQEEKQSTLPKFITGISEKESAKRGIATHTVLQFCDFERLASFGTEAELDRLEKEEFISREDRARVRVSEINKFVKSPLFEKIRGAKNLYREFRFNVKLPAENFTLDEAKREKLKGAHILVQGVIDCLIENEDGTLHLVDYKTDRLTKEELSSPNLAEERLKKSHRLQLSYYGKAVELIFKKAPSKIGIYSLHLGKEILL